jgi:hypothetical protein
MGGYPHTRNGDLMTDTTDSTEAHADETPTDAPPVEVAAPDSNSEIEKWKALARKNEARAKENADKAKRFDEIEEASKTELEKAQAQLAELQRERDEANAARMRSEIARTTGVPVELLTGSDEASLTAQAASLLAFKGMPPTAPSSEGQGKVGEPVGAGVKQLTREDIKRMSPAEIVAAQDSGQFDDLLGVKSH